MSEQDRASYISDGLSSLAKGTAGVVHGGVNFVTNNLFGLASLAYMGCFEFEDDWEARLAFHQGLPLGDRIEKKHISTSTLYQTQ